MHPLRPLPDRPRRYLTSFQVLPTVITLGNLIAGVLAIAYLINVGGEPEVSHGLLEKAAWLIFIGMFCDAADGRIARMTRTTSPFGAQLDSLCDIVTFGVAPALLAKSWLVATFPNVPERMLFAVAVVYVVGAALRLARYNVEAEQSPGHDTGEATHIFSGLPTPAAAGVVAATVLVHHEYGLRYIEWSLLAMLPLLGFLMISRMPYAHVLNQLFDGSRPLATIIVIVVLVFFAVTFFKQTVAVAFYTYALSGPLRALAWRMTGRSGLHQEAGDEMPPSDAAAARQAERP